MPKKEYKYVNIVEKQGVTVQYYFTIFAKQ